MRLTFRATLLILLGSLLVFFIGGVGLTSYYFARRNAEELTAQTLEQASWRIDQWTRNLLDRATSVSRLNASMIEDGRLNPADFPQLAVFWLELMRLHPQLTYLSLGSEAEGEYVHVTRLSDGKLSIRELRRNRGSGKLEMSDYWPEDYPSKRYHFDPDRDAGDPRKRPYYLAAREAKRQIWTETYVFLGVEGVADVPGVTCATPLYRRDGSLIGVLTADFDLYALSEFLQGLRLFDTGFAFVVESARDRRRVIAHPDPKCLMRDIQKQVTVHELVDADKLADPRVRGFMSELEASSLPEGETLRSLRFSEGGRAYLSGVRRLAGPGSPPWLICMIVPEPEVMGHVQKNNRMILLIGLGGLAVAILISVLLASRISQPLKRLAGEAEAIGQFRLQAGGLGRSPIIEVDRLMTAAEEMKAGLRSFQKYVPADLVRSLLASGQEARLGGQRRPLTVFFSDLAGFTSISERLPPEDLVEQLGEYLSAFSEEIEKARGTVDKYIGDAVMAFWGAPEPNPDQALLACAAAWHAQARMRDLRKRWNDGGKPSFTARIGIHTGESVIGNMGCETRLNYTAIGDSVNLASRLEGLNKLYGTSILISETTRRECGDRIVARPVDRVAVRGKTQGLMIYELLGMKGEVSGREEALVARSTSALEAYFRRDWEGALKEFGAILRESPEDPVALQLAARCRAYRESPPPPDWSGTFKVEIK